MTLLFDNLPIQPAPGTTRPRHAPFQGEEARMSPWPLETKIIEFETTGDVRAFVARIAELAAENERERVG